MEIAKALIHKHGVDPDQIVALTPYSAQKEEIKAHLENQKVAGVVVKTITESQGVYRGLTAGVRVVVCNCCPYSPKFQFYN